MVNMMGILLVYVCLYIMWGEVPAPSHCLYQKSDVLPIAGSPTRLPAVSSFPCNSSIHWAGDSWAFCRSNNTNYFRFLLDDLLNLGADRPGPIDDSSVQIIPVLDGNQPPIASIHYSMKFVLFDVKLVSLDFVDPLGSSFKAHWQIIFNWEEWMGPNREELPNAPNCTFACDNTNDGSSCCDDVWLPHLQITGCSFDTVDSVVEFPLMFSYRKERYHTWQKENHSPDATPQHYCSIVYAECYRRRIWKLNIISSCDAQMTFENFPFDRQQLNIDISNTYSSSIWLQLVQGSLLVAGGDITNEASPLDEKIPGWYIEDVKVSVRSGAYSWRRTVSTLNMILQNVSSGAEKYPDQESQISEALTQLDFLHSYQNLEPPENSSLYDMENLGIYGAMVENYEERIVATLNQYRNCVKDHGIDYTCGNDSVTLTPRRNETLSSMWLNVTSQQKTKVSLPCLIEAAANLTTPRIRVTIHIRRYRMYYVMKLFMPTIACGAFSFAVIGIPPTDLVGRLAVVIPSALALTALQVVVVAADLPAVTYFVATMSIIAATYFAQVLVVLESIIVAVCGSMHASKKGVEKEDAAVQSVAPSVDSQTCYNNSLSRCNEEILSRLQNGRSGSNIKENLQSARFAIELATRSISELPQGFTPASMEANNGQKDNHSMEDNGEEDDGNNNNNRDYERNLCCWGIFVQRKYTLLFPRKRPNFRENWRRVDMALLMIIIVMYATAVSVFLIVPILKSNRANGNEGISIRYD